MDEMEPIDPEELEAWRRKITDAIVAQIMRVNEMIYRWHRDRTAPYYLPPARATEGAAQPKDYDKSREDI